MSNNKDFCYCFRVYDYEQYLHDVGELRAMGYNIDDKWSAGMIQCYPNFRGLWLHIVFECAVDDIPEVTVHSHNYLVERVPNLDYIINELPVFKTSSKAV